MADLLKELQSPAKRVVGTTEVEESFAYQGLPDGQASEAFGRAIMESCSRSDLSEPCRHTVYNEELILTGCVAGVTSPFSQVTGKHENNLVIVSKKEECLDNSYENAVNKKLLFNPPFTYQVQRQATPMTTKTTSHKLVLPDTPTLITLRDNCTLPLSLDHARALISLYATWCAARSEGESPPELWVLCTGSKDVVALGCRADSSRILHLTKVTKLSPCLSWPSSESSIKLDKYLCNTRKATKSSISSKTKYFVNSVYEFGPSLEDDLECPFSSTSAMRMHFVWDSAGPSLSSPPSSSAEAVLSISVMPGSQVSPVLGIFCEIQKLYQLSQMTEESENLGWSEIGENAVTDVPSRLVSKVNTFLEELSTHMLRAIDVSVLSPTAALSPFQPREDLDFLGQLWVFLMEASSGKDLVESLGHILKAIVLDQVQPFIHQNKQSNLAVLCRRNLSSSSPDEAEVIAMKLQSLLTEERALKSLVEIGIEKMQRDYWSFFTTNELCTGSELERFFAQKGSLLDQCKMLCKLHCIIELTACLMTFLSLPKSSLVIFVQQTLEYYYSQYTFEDFSVTPTFSLPFTTFDAGLKCLTNFAVSLKPITSSVSFSVGPDNHQVLCCSMEPLYQHLTSSDSSLAEDKESTMYVYRASEQTVTL